MEASELKVYDIPELSGHDTTDTYHLFQKSESLHDLFENLFVLAWQPGGMAHSASQSSNLSREKKGKADKKLNGSAPKN